MEELRKLMEDLRITGNPAEIRTEYLRNRSLERYWYASLLGMGKYIGGRWSSGFLLVTSV
jgi:hypothetical protein